MISGIYWIYQVSRDRAVYVGSSVNVEQRIKYHLSYLRRGKHRNRKLQNTWLKYGADDFFCSLLEPVEQTRFVEREQFWMDAMPVWPSCNIELATKNFAFGNKLSAEAVEKLRLRSLGNKYSLGIKLGPMSEERKKHLSSLLTGRKLTDETKAKISKALRGRPKSKEHIDNAATAHRAVGYTYSEQTKKLWSEQRKGKPWSVARRAAQNKRLSQNIDAEG